jgi:hypothetical protein
MRAGCPALGSAQMHVAGLKLHVAPLQLSKLLEEIAHGPLWTQDLYGGFRQYLGPVHGYAGNMLPLMRHWHWLTVEQRNRITDAVPRTLAINAWRSDLGTSWRAVAGDQPPTLCQHCHRAPGMVTTFADAPFSSPELKRDNHSSVISSAKRATRQAARHLSRRGELNPRPSARGLGAGHGFMAPCTLV